MAFGVWKILARYTHTSSEHMHFYLFVIWTNLIQVCMKLLRVQCMHFVHRNMLQCMPFAHHSSTISFRHPITHVKIEIKHETASMNYYHISKRTKTVNEIRIEFHYLSHIAYVNPRGFGIAGILNAVKSHYGKRQ